MQVAGSLGGLRTGTPPGRYPEAERVHGKNGTAPRMAPADGDRHRHGGGGWREHRSGSQERWEPHESRMRERVEMAPQPDSYRIGGDPEIGCKGGLEDIRKLRRRHTSTSHVGTPLERARTRVFARVILWDSFE